MKQDAMCSSFCDGMGGARELRGPPIVPPPLHSQRLSPLSQLRRGPNVGLGLGTPYFKYTMTAMRISNSIALSAIIHSFHQQT